MNYIQGTDGDNLGPDRLADPNHRRQLQDPCLEILTVHVLTV